MHTTTEEPIDVRIARRLRAARLDALLTVREAAMQAGLPDHTQLVKYENGDVRPPLQRLAALARVYGLTLAALVAEHDAAMSALSAIDRMDAGQLAELTYRITRADVVKP